MSQLTLGASKWQDPCLNQVPSALEPLPPYSGPSLGIPLPSSVNQHTFWNPLALRPQLFEDRECFVQHCVIPSVQSSAWHNEYLLSERVNEWWLLTTYFFPNPLSLEGWPC